jgi:outer membrane protein assembly factor BamB
MVAGGRVYIGTRTGELLVFSADKEKRLLDTIDFGSPISSTVTAANGALFIATMNKLYCVKQERTGVLN